MSIIRNDKNIKAIENGNQRNGLDFRTKYFLMLPLKCPTYAINNNEINVDVAEPRMPI